MAAFFLLLALIVGAVIGDAMVANTSADSVRLFNQTITGFTQGQLLLIAAGAGFLFAAFVFLMFGSTKGRRLRRRERRDLEGRTAELERENAALRDEVDRDPRTSRLGEMSGAEGTADTTQTSRPIFSRRTPDHLDQRAAATDSTTRRDMFNEADR